VIDRVNPSIKAIMELEFQDRKFLQRDGGNKYFRLLFAL
jgi:hypothetical protein